MLCIDQLITDLDMLGFWSTFLHDFGKFDHTSKSIGLRN